jgi:hypothetical protein
MWAVAVLGRPYEEQQSWLTFLAVETMSMVRPELAVVLMSSVLRKPMASFRLRSPLPTWRESRKKRSLPEYPA